MCNLLHAIIACNLLHAMNCTCNHGLSQSPDWTGDTAQPVIRPHRSSTHVEP